MNNRYNFQKGQAGIVAILVGIVIFTLGMGVSARVVSDVRTASRAEEGARAYLAAEAAMERALSQTVQQLDNNPNNTSAWGGDSFVDNVSYVAAPQPDRNRPAGQPYLYKMGPLSAGDSRTVWLVDLVSTPNLDPFHSQAVPYSSNFRIDWVSLSPSGPDTKIELAFYYRSNSSGEDMSVWRQYLTTAQGSINIDPQDPDPASGLRPPDFQPGGNDQFYLLRIKVIASGSGVTFGIYPNDTIGVDDFPIQEFTIEANAETRDNKIRRRVIATKKVGDAPIFLDYVLANTGGGLVKNN